MFTITTKSGVKHPRRWDTKKSVLPRAVTTTDWRNADSLLGTGTRFEEILVSTVGDYFHETMPSDRFEPEGVVKPRATTSWLGLGSLHLLVLVFDMKHHSTDITYEFSDIFF